MKTYIATFDTFKNNGIFEIAIEAKNKKEAEKEARYYNRLNGSKYRLLSVEKAPIFED